MAQNAFLYIGINIVNNKFLINKKIKDFFNNIDQNITNKEIVKNFLP